MQISALNTIIAAQQAKSAQASRPAVAPQAKPAAPGFEPMAFAASPAEEAQAPAKPAYSASAPLGSQVDIRI